MLCTCILFAHFYGAFAIISDCATRMEISFCVVLILTAISFASFLARVQRGGVWRGKLKKRSGRKGTPPVDRTSTCSPPPPLPSHRTPFERHHLKTLHSPIHSWLEHHCIFEVNVLYFAAVLCKVTHSTKKQFHVLGAVFQGRVGRLIFHLNNLLLSRPTGLSRASWRVLLRRHVYPLNSTHAVVPVYRLPKGTM